MPWCPKCLVKYDEEWVNTCADCHVPLVDELHIQSEMPQNFPPHDLGEPVLLIALDDAFEANMLLGLLQEQKIPAFKKGRGAGGYFDIMMGVNSFGTDIYVPQQLLTQARELAETLHPPEGARELPIMEEDALDDEDELNVEKLPYPVMQDMRKLGRFILWLCLIGCIVGMFWQYTGFLGKLRELFFG